jgi:hypothetical protein
MPLLTSSDSFVIVSDHKSDRGKLAGRRSIDVIVTSFPITLFACETIIGVSWG